MNEDSGKRGLRAFVDWVKNSPDWGDEVGVCEGGAGGHGGENGGYDGKNGGRDGENGGHGVTDTIYGAADTMYVSGQAVRGNTRQTMDRRLAESTEEHTLRVFSCVYQAVAQIVYPAGMAVLFMMVAHPPVSGPADNLTNDGVVGRYLENGLSETGAVNMVAGIILDYRVFDTFGEFVVLFLAVVSVIVFPRLKTGSGYSGKEDRSGGTEHEEDEEGDIILEQVAGLLIPFTPMSGVYVVLSGHLSPGGGFSGGTAIGTSLILYANAFRHWRVHHFFSFKTFTVVSSNALMVYTLPKGYSLFMRVDHLESGTPLGRSGNTSNTGPILLLDIYVGLMTAGTMYCFYSLSQEREA